MLKAALDRLAARIAFIMIAALLGLAGAGFLLASFFLWLAEILSPPAAAFLTGVITLVAAAVPTLFFWFQGHSERSGAISSRRQWRETESSDAAAMASALGAELGSWVESNSRTAVLGALLTGVLLGASPRARAELRKFLETVGGKRGSPN